VTFAFFGTLISMTSFAIGHFPNPWVFRYQCNNLITFFISGKIPISFFPCSVLLLQQVYGHILRQNVGFFHFSNINLNSFLHGQLTHFQWNCHYQFLCITPQF